MRAIYRFWVYMMSNKARTVIYTGVTNDLLRRYEEHYKGLVEGFTSKYNCKDLIYFEEFDDINEAIKREKKIKTFSRKEKEELIATKNPLKKRIDPEEIE